MNSTDSIGYHVLLQAHLCSIVDYYVTYVIDRLRVYVRTYVCVLAPPYFTIALQYQLAVQCRHLHAESCPVLSCAVCIKDRLFLAASINAWLQVTLTHPRPRHSVKRLAI